MGFGHMIILAWKALLTFSQVLQISAKLSLSSLSVLLQLLRAQLPNSPWQHLALILHYVHDSLINTLLP